ncbi:MAG: extracellular solute-binding protein, partial [Clostridiales bacterium]|nr:extracellular solute-binding protein [Clostridiales bacterium]
MKRISLILVLLLALTLFACQKSENATPTHGAEEILSVRTASAGERFAAAPVALQEGYSLIIMGGAYRNASGEFLLAAQKLNTAGRSADCSLFRFSADGALLSAMEIPFGDADYLAASAFDGESFWYVLGWVGDKRTYRLERMSLTDGSLLLDTALDSLPEIPPEWAPSVMAVAGDGTVWMTSNGDTYAYGADLQSVYRVRAGTWISSMAVDPDGAVWACTNYGLDIGWGAAKLNRETGSYDEAISLDSGTRNISFTADGTLYFDTADGVSRLVTGEDGTRTAESVMNFIASGIIRSLGGISASGEHDEFLHVIAPDALLFYSIVQKDGQSYCLPTLYRPSEEEIPAETVTIQLAFAVSMDDNIKAEIVRFNRDHPGTEVSLLDYSIYDTDAQQKLMIDILNGIVTPDMVYGYDNSLSIRTLRDKGLTVDLTPYLAADDTVNEENLFGSLLSYFRGRDGGIWGIAPYFSKMTFFSTSSLLRGYADDNGWDLGTFFDFAASLPEGQVLTTNASRGKYPIPTVDEQFIDRDAGTCSFDSPLYVRYLEFLASLPEEKEVRRLLPSMNPQRYYLEGKVALVRESADDSGPLYFESVFNDPDYVIVGYPSEDPLHRALLSAEHTFVIMKTSAHPDLSWEFIRTAFRSPNEQEWMFGVGKSSLKSIYDEEAQSMRDHLMLHFSSGRWDMMISYKPDEFEG